MPGYAAEAIYGAWAPAKTPTAIVNRLNQEIVNVLNAPQNRERLIGTGVEVVGSTPEAFAAEIKAETVRLEKVFRAAGIKAQ